VFLAQLLTHIPDPGQVMMRFYRTGLAIGLLMAACFVAWFAWAHRPAAEPTVYRVWFLGGQSNMEGFGFAADLEPEARGRVPGVMIFNGRAVPDGESEGGQGLWAPLTPGFGLGFATDGKTNTLSDRFGPELSFGRRLAERGTGPVALVKFARGGSGLMQGVSGFGSWDPDYATGNRRNQYDNALTAIRTALETADIDGDGRPDRLIPAGIIWMQGEADAYDRPDAAAAYRANLDRLMNLLRAALRVDDLPVVIGRIADSGQDSDGVVMTYGAVVQQAQADWVAADACAALVSVTRDFHVLPDKWHYDSAGYLTLGAAFADAALALDARCGP
jgi:hypothetical protein